MSNRALTPIFRRELTISNFSSLCDERIKGHPFLEWQLTTDPRHKSILVLYPKGINTESKDYISLDYVAKLKYPYTECKIYTLDADKREEFIERGECVSDLNSEVYDSNLKIRKSKYIIRNHLLNQKLRFLVDDKLTICVEGFSTIDQDSMFEPNHKDEKLIHFDAKLSPIVPFVHIVTIENYRELFEKNQRTKESKIALTELHLICRDNLVVLKLSLHRQTSPFLSLSLKCAPIDQFSIPISVKSNIIDNDEKEILSSPNENILLRNRYILLDVPYSVEKLEKMNALSNNQVKYKIKIKALNDEQLFLERSSQNCQNYLRLLNGFDDEANVIFSRSSVDENGLKETFGPEMTTELMKESICQIDKITSNQSNICENVTEEEIGHIENFLNIVSDSDKEINSSTQDSIDAIERAKQKADIMLRYDKLLYQAREISSLMENEIQKMSSASSSCDILQSTIEVFEHEIESSSIATLETSAIGVCEKSIETKQDNSELSYLESSVIKIYKEITSMSAELKVLSTKKNPSVTNMVYHLENARNFVLTANSQTTMRDVTFNESQVDNRKRNSISASVSVLEKFSFKFTEQQKQFDADIHGHYEKLEQLKIVFQKMNSILINRIDLQKSMHQTTSEEKNTRIIKIRNSNPYSTKIGIPYFYDGRISRPEIVPNENNSGKGVFKSAYKGFMGFFIKPVRKFNPWNMLETD